MWALGIVAIVLIVIGSIIVLSIVITILICCCLCRKRTIGGQVGYIQPTYVVTNPNPVTYPLSPGGYWGYLRIQKILNRYMNYLIFICVNYS